MDGTGEIDTKDAVVAPEEVVAGASAEPVDNEPQERDYEAEARAHGWTDESEFKGDKSKFVDAKTFVERADTFMPFLQKQNKALKREMDDLKRTMKQASTFYSKAEERAYQRALADLENKHDQLVEEGDKVGARKVLKEITDLEKPAPAETEDKPDTKQAQQELADWVDRNDWYVNDEKKRAYADIQAGAMGPADEWEGGRLAWLDELGKRVNRKFAEPKPNPTNGGGNRSNGAARGEKTFADLPAEAKAACDKFHRSGVFGDPEKVTLADARKRYVADYDWS